MVEHVDGDDAVGAYLRGDVVAFGTELEVVSAGGCSTITPVDMPAALATLYVICTGSVGTCRAVM